MIRVTLSMLLLLTFAMQTAHADVTYDGGTPQRPTAFTNVLINGTTYNVSVTYNNNGATNPIRVGALPDADIGFARTALQTDLNDESIDSNVTVLYFQPNVDTAILPPGNFQSTGGLGDVTVGLNDWQNDGNVIGISGAANMLPSRGFTSFTVIPEPSSLGFLGLICFGLAISRRKGGWDFFS